MFMALIPHRYLPATIAYRKFDEHCRPPFRTAEPAMTKQPNAAWDLVR